MPATKKVVNPEKELRGKKPYNRGGPNGLKKKSYQAKPKKLDEDEVPEGAAALKKKLRDTLRLLSNNPKMPADVRLEHERRIEALNLQIAEKQVDQTEQKMATKYRMVRFFESKKADRRLKVFFRQNPNWEQIEEQKKEVESLQLDLAYIQHFPKTLKYISLYPNENADDPAVSSARNEIREKIRVGLESGEVTQFVKAAREEVKAKIISKDTLSTEEAVKLTTEKINSSKKRARDDEDPMSSRAKATAEREKSKPKQVDVVEEETFFETVPKVVAAAEIKEPANKKTKAEKKAEAPAKQTKKEQPKKEQVKKEQVKKEQVKKEQPKKEQAKKEQPKKEQPKKEQPKKNEKKDIATAASPAATNDASTEGGEVKKLGKWARKAIRAQSTFAANETAASESGSTPSTNGSTDAVVAEETSVDNAEVQPEEEKKEVKKPENKKSKAKKPEAKKPEAKKPETKKPEAKKPEAKKAEIKKAGAKKEQPVEKKVEEKKVEEKKVEKKTVEKKKVEKKVEKKEVEEKKVEDKIEGVKQDAPKITTLKVNHDDRDDSDSDNEDEPAAPVRKIVKIDESLLKELPEVPKRRGGRNLNKFRQ